MGAPPALGVPTQPTASNLNYTTGAVVPNAVIAKIGANGQVCVFVSMATDLIVDVNGYFPTTTSLSSINPARVGNATWVDDQRRVATSDRDTCCRVGHRGADRRTRHRAERCQRGRVERHRHRGPRRRFVTVYPCGTAIPTASNINYITGSTVANLVVAKIGTASQVCIYTSNTVDLIADINGYFPAKTTYRPLEPARLVETRAGLTTIDTKFQGIGQRSQNSVLALDVTGRGGVPFAATTAVLNITITAPTGPGFITAYPCGFNPPLASNLNYAAGSTVANAVIAKIGTNEQTASSTPHQPTSSSTSPATSTNTGDVDGFGQSRPLTLSRALSMRWSAFSLTSLTACLALPARSSALPSRFRSLLSVRSPTACLIRPFA
jgi:hypothetical protein